MTTNGWVIFVEDENDQALVLALVANLDLTNIEVEYIGGGASRLKYRAVQNQIRRRRDLGWRVATILDADDDAANRRREWQEANEELGSAIERAFWIPNDADPGCVEMLLEQMAVEQHRVVFDCLDQYIECLQEFDETYAGPGAKGRIYAYCEAVGAGAKEKERAYDDEKYWNLDVPALSPLKTFLEECR